MAQRAPFDVTTVLGPVRRRLWLARILQGCMRGLAVGAAFGILFLLADHVHRFSIALQLAVATTLLSAIGGSLWGARARPNALQAARAVDHHFELHDRVTTALELRHDDGEFPQMQRVQAESRLRGLQLTQSTRGRVRRRELGIPAIALIALLAISFWAVPATTVPRAAHAAGDSKRILQVAKRSVPAITKKLETSLTAAQRNNPALRKLEATLAKLRKQLLHTSNRAAALRAISAAQLNLHQLSQSLHPISNHSISQLNSSLSHYMTQQQRTAAQAGNKRALAAAASTLQRLSQQLAHMSPAQRAQLAKALARAANRTSDSQTRAALHQAASSLAYQDPQTAASQLQKAASALQNSPGTQTAQSQAQRASTELESLKSEVSGLNSPGQQTPGQSGQQPPGSQGQPQGGPNGKQPTGQGSQPGSGKKGSSGNGLGPVRGQVAGKGKGKGQGQGTGKGKGSGKGTGQGQGQGKGRGKGTGQGQGTGKGSILGQRGGLGQGQGTGTTGRGTPGGRGAGGGRGSAGRKGQGKYATVYAPGKQGKGPQSTQTGPVGRPQTGPIVPYTQVVQQYVNAAHTALDRSALPPSVQRYVQKYFTAISR